MALCLLGAELKPDELLTKEAVSYRAEGLRHQKVGEIEKAGDAFRKAVLADPTYTDAYNDLGVALESLGDSEGAERAYKTAVQLKPDFSAAHSNLALLYEKKGRVQEAANHWAARIRIGIADDPWVVRAREKLTQYNLPVPEWPALTSRKKEAVIRLGMETGLSRMRAGRWEEAAEEFRRVLEVEPGNFKAAEHLHTIESKLGASPPAKLTVKPPAAPPRAPRPAVAVLPKPAPPSAKKEPEKEPVKGREEALSRALEWAKKPEPPSPVAPSDALEVAAQVAKEKSQARQSTVRELYQRSVTAMRQGRYEEASTLFQQVLTLHPDHSEARQGLKRAQAVLAKLPKTAKNP
ncbi:MAG: tetratricopeptide repeat protein [Candidatus Omnitrophica bacterium]|nr:tetratricopeptide repeat protein [Candidatus Omnitrophota bacterium]